MLAFAHDRFTFPLPAGHRFPLAKYALVRALVEDLPGVTIVEGRPATWEEVALAHDAEWIRRVRFGLLDRREAAGLGLPWSPALVTRALHASGSTIEAIIAARRDGVAVCLGGGMHHAAPGVGRGFCTLNDVAVALAVDRARSGRARVLLLDLDVHQGDGNAEFYAADPDVTVVSLHGARNYPFARAASDLDVDLPTAPATTTTSPRSMRRSRGRSHAAPTPSGC